MRFAWFWKIASFSSKRKMSNTFTVRVNPLNGTKEWIVQSHLYDYYQEVARSSYADMLHDDDRNKKYFSAISEAVQSTKAAGKQAKVLDIGTGTGLLSMMAAKCGADNIVACELFFPMAQCAQKIIKDNGYEDKIKVVHKPSTELKVGKGEDLEERANILVAEVFDTELIGEGALSTFKHALENLMEPHSLVVPSSATVYVQVVDSDLISYWNKIKDLHLDSKNVILAPEDVKCCSGSPAVHDLQMSELPEDCFSSLTTPVPIFKFDFTGKTPICMQGSKIKETEVIKTGKCDAVFMWWTLKMNEGGDIILNNGPKWFCSPNNMHWRDHWMQGIYHLPDTVPPVTENNKLFISGHYDELSMYFAVSGNSPEKILDYTITDLLKPACTCLAHVSDSRSRIALKNDTKRLKKYTEMLRKVITSDSVCLCIGDGSLLPLIAAKLGAKKVFTVEPNNSHQRLIQSYITVNGFQDVVKVINKEPVNLSSDDLEGNKVDVLISEPYFANCIHPWDLLCFVHMRKIFHPFLNADAVVIPEKGHIRGIVVEFEDLHKIRAPVESVMDFKLKEFDSIIQKAICEIDAAVEPHQLWEYPGKAMSQVFDVFSFDFANPITTNKVCISNSQNVIGCGTCNGVALWIDYSFKGEVVTNGPLVAHGSVIKWPMNCQQGIYFLKPFTRKTYENKALKYSVSFDLQTGEMTFKFDMEHSISANGHKPGR